MKISADTLAKLGICLGLFVALAGTYGASWLWEESHLVALITTGIAAIHLIFLAASFAAGATENNKRRAVYFLLLLLASIVEVVGYVVSMYAQGFMRIPSIKWFIVTTVAVYGGGCAFAGFVWLIGYMASQYGWYQTKRKWKKDAEAICTRHGK